MDCTTTQLSYGETGYFTSIVNAYVSRDQRLRPFYNHDVSIDGIQRAIDERRKTPGHRPLLVSELTKQYAAVPAQEKVVKNISLLSNENTFTITTAHQPAIFTGNLFFIYKILHVIRVADELSTKFPDNHFVPVYYMGSEDADLEELGHIFLDGQKLEWDTKQKGAIGRMQPKGLDKILNRIEGELSVLPCGDELITLLKKCYLESENIQSATFKLVHHLFAGYGLVVLIPDNAALKNVMLPVFEKDLFGHASSAIVEKTIDSLSKQFKVQAQPRDINLFYLNDGIRERIERQNGDWKVVNTSISFDDASLKKELNEHPERFSPNVILRGLFQSTILPDVVFIGGGGEIAYWLELKDLFNHWKVPYPVLIIRNSFLLIENKWREKLHRLRLGIKDIFRDERELINELVKRDSARKLTLAEEISEVSSYYENLKTVAEQVDGTLTSHVAALQTRAIKPLQELEKKMLRAEKRKFSDQERQLSNIKNVLFPNKSLQERVDNFMPFYAKWGAGFIRMIYDHSLTLEQKFVVLEVKE